MRKRAFWSLSILLLAAAVPVLPLLVPDSFIKGWVETRASEALGRPAVVRGAFSLRRWPPLRLDLEQVEVAEDASIRTPLAKIERIELDLDAWALLKGRVHVRRLALIAPEVSLRTDADGHFNGRLPNTLSRAEQPGGSPVLLEIDTLVIEGGRVTYRDETRPDVPPLDLEVAGALTLRPGARPHLDGRLNFGKAILDALIVTPSKSDGGGSEWSDDPLRLPLPLPLDCDLILTLTGIEAGRETIGPGRLHLLADEAQIRVTVDELALYDGHTLGVIRLFGFSPLRLDVQWEAGDVRLRPLLEAWAGLDRFEGRAHLQFTATTGGDSLRTLIGGLGGRGTFEVRDGAITGVDLAASVRQFATLGLLDDDRSRRRTDFSELTGSVTARDGIVGSSDVFLRSPLFRMRGEGTVDLVERTIALRLRPNLASTIEGQDALHEPNFQAGLPLNIDGPWDDPQIRLEVNGRLSADLRRPGALDDLLESLADRSSQWDYFKQQLGLDRDDNPAGSIFKRLFGD
ncbi:MAG: AsmA family protein [Geminicoccaceae bacterium]|nr:AsmA family protein [Geminicoccaceae bacterium]